MLKGSSRLQEEKKNDSRIAHTYQEGKTGDSGPIMDYNAVGAALWQKNNAENLSCCCAAYQHSSPYFAVA